MAPLSELLGRWFERVLRWVYPGVLFAVLLALAHPSIFEWWQSMGDGEPSATFGDRLLVALAVVVSASFAIYMVHRQVVNELLTLLLYCFDLAAFPRKQEQKGQQDGSQRWWQRFGSFLPNYVRNHSRHMQTRFGYLGPCGKRDAQRMSDYLVNRWAATHAMGLTIWLIAVMYMIGEPSSPIKLLPVLGVALLLIFLFVAYIHAVLLLHDVERGYFPEQGSSPA